MQSFASSKIKLPLRALSFLTLFEWPPQKLAKTQNDMISRNRANREHDVTSNGKRQKWNISCRLYSAVYTVEWKYLYSRWIVGDIYLFLCDDLVRIRRKEHKFRGNREIKHDVYSKRQTANDKWQKWNFCRLSSAVCTVEWSYLYLQWMVGDVIPCLCALFTVRRKELKIRSYLCRLPLTSCLTSPIFAVCRLL